MARIFLSRILDTLRQCHNKKFIALNSEFQTDVLWFHTFAQHFNGVAFFDKWPLGIKCFPQWFRDVCANMVYAVPFSVIQQQESPSLHFSKVHWNVQYLSGFKTLGKCMEIYIIHIKWDNQAMVSILNTGKFPTNTYVPWQHIVPLCL